MLNMKSSSLNMHLNNTCLENRNKIHESYPTIKYLNTDRNLSQYYDDLHIDNKEVKREESKEDALYQRIEELKEFSISEETKGEDKQMHNYYNEETNSQENCHNQELCDKLLNIIDQILFNEEDSFMLKKTRGRPKRRPLINDKILENIERNWLKNKKYPSTIVIYRYIK